MRHASIALVVMLAGLTSARAAGPLALTAIHSEPMDGSNTFPAAG
jgi:hypothetical protein